MPETDQTKPRRGFAGFRRHRPEWFWRVTVGSVLRERHGPFRIVRAATYRPDGSVRTVNLTIRRRSWTGRCYTVVFDTDLMQRGFTMVDGVRVKLPKTQMDILIERAIHQPAHEKYVITADEVVGIP